MVQVLSLSGNLSPGWVLFSYSVGHEIGCQMSQKLAACSGLVFLLCRIFKTSFHVLCSSFANLHFCSA